MKNLNIELTDSLKDIWAKVTDQLTNLKTDRKSSNKTMILGTVAENSVPESRIVVLRDIVFKPLTFVLFTDTRSPKIQELTLQPIASVLLYDTNLSRQLRGKAEATIVTDLLSLTSYWDDYKVKAKDYSTVLAPSTEVPSQDDILKESSEAFTNFGVVFLQIRQLEVLELGIESHFRAKFQLDSTGAYSSASWLVP